MVEGVLEAAKWSALALGRLSTGPAKGNTGRLTKVDI
jgi:hypothetical protein